MKILHITPWYEPAWASGGTAVSVSSLCRELYNQGADITVLTTTDLGDGSLLSKKSLIKKVGGVEVRYSSCGILGLNYRRAAFSFKMVLDIIKLSKNYDLVHIHSTRHIYGLVLAILAPLYKTPYVITPHASLMDFWMNTIGSSIFKKFYAKTFDKIYIKNATKIHFLSKYEKESSANWTFGKDSFVLPNGIVNFNKGIVKSSYNGGKIKLLHVGRIHPQKNTFELVKAVGELGSNIASLDIIGEIDDKNYYKKCNDYLESISANNISFIGKMDYEDVQLKYKEYDLFCMPSLVEGVSMALIEAASAGLPSLVSKNVGNYREIIEDESGILCGLSSDSIKKEIMSITENPTQLNRLSTNAFLTTKKRYSLKLVVKELINTYKHIYKKRYSN